MLEKVEFADNVHLQWHGSCNGKYAVNISARAEVSLRIIAEEVGALSKIGVERIYKRNRFIIRRHDMRICDHNTA